LLTCARISWRSLGMILPDWTVHNMINQCLYHESSLSWNKPNSIGVWLYSVRDNMYYSMCTYYIIYFATTSIKHGIPNPVFRTTKNVVREHGNSRIEPIMLQPCLCGLRTRRIKPNRCYGVCRVVRGRDNYYGTTAGDHIDLKVELLSIFCISITR